MWKFQCHFLLRRRLEGNSVTHRPDEIPIPWQYTSVCHENTQTTFRKFFTDILWSSADLRFFSIFCIDSYKTRMPLHTPEQNQIKSSLILLHWSFVHLPEIRFPFSEGCFRSPAGSDTLFSPKLPVRICWQRSVRSYLNLSPWMQTSLPFFQTGAAIHPEVRFSDIFHNIIPVGILLSFHSPVHLPLTVTQTDLLYVIDR